MKGYCVDVRGFSLAKKVMVAEAIAKLSDIRPVPYDGLISNCDKIVTIGPARGAIFSIVVCSRGELSPTQTPHQISFNDLMIEAGFNYEDRGVEDFGWIDLSKCTITENKPISNKTRPQITREQYDAVMAQSDKRTFTKALDDLLAIEKEQLLDESAIRIDRLKSEVEYLNKVISSKNEELECALDIVNQLNKKNVQLSENAKEDHELWVKFDKLNDKHRQSLEKQKLITGVLSLLLISSVAALLVGIFLGSPSA